MLTHNGYIKKRDEILTALVVNYASDQDYDIVEEMDYDQAAQAIDALVLEVIGSNDKESLREISRTVSMDEARAIRYENLNRNALRTEQLHIVTGGQS